MQFSWRRLPYYSTCWLVIVIWPTRWQSAFAPASSIFTARATIIGFTIRCCFNFGITPVLPAVQGTSSGIESTFWRCRIHSFFWRTSGIPASRGRTAHETIAAEERSTNSHERARNKGSASSYSCEFVDRVSVFLWSISLACWILQAIRGEEDEPDSAIRKERD